MKKLFLILVLFAPLLCFAQPSKDFKNGRFGMKFSDGEIAEGYHIIRKGKRQIEHYEEFTSEYMVEWVSEYSYKLTLLKTNRPGVESNDVIVNILSVKKDEYTAYVNSSQYGEIKVIIFRLN